MKIFLSLLFIIPVTFITLGMIPTTQHMIKDITRIFDTTSTEYNNWLEIGNEYIVCIDNYKYRLTVTPEGTNVLQMFNYIRISSGLVPIPIKCK